jgi:hypothetical protein
MTAFEEHHEYGTAAPRLKVWMETNGLTQARLASLTGGTDNFITKIFKQQSRPEAKRMLIIELITNGAVRPAHWFPSGAFDEYLARFSAYKRAWELEKQEEEDSPGLPPRYRYAGGRA